MKRIILAIFCLTLLFNITGCFKRDTMEDIDIYTTIYPITYITNFLYGNHAQVFSIYPNNIDVFQYQLTEKQLVDYSKASLFVYNGLSGEKDYAISMLNQNKKLKIIDAVMNMEYINSIEELWLDPSNFLMLSQNIRRGFEEYVSNPYLKNEIKKNDELLKIQISEIDAEMKLIVQNAEHKTILVTSNLFLFLEKYEFEVISLEKETITDKALAGAINLIDKGIIQYIFIDPNQELNDQVNDLINNYNLTPLAFKTAINLSEQEVAEKTNFIDLMNYNIDLLKKELYQ